MKKLFLMLAMIPALCMVSCSKDNNPEEPNDGPSKPGNSSQVTLSEAVYYGEKIVNGVGYYSLTFEKGDQTLRLDLFGSVANDPNAATLGGGDYSLTTVEKPANKTFFLAQSTTDAMGTLFWNNGSPVLVTGGTVTVNVAAGGLRITVSLTAGSEQIDWVYNGRITFINKYERAPRTPMVADLFGMSYRGKLDPDDPNNNLGYISIAIADSSAPNTIVNAFLTVEIPADLERIEIPTGTFEVADEPMVANKIVAGFATNEGIGGSFEGDYTNAGGMKGAVLIQSGSLTITKVADNTYHIKTDFNGNRIAGGSSIVDMGPEPGGIIYEGTIDDAPDYVPDSSRPISSLTEDVDVTDAGFVNCFFDVWYYNEEQTQLIYRMIFFTEDIVVAESASYNSTASLQVGGGEGAFVVLQITGGSVVEGAGAMLDGEFPMYGQYDYEYEHNTTRPAMPGSNYPFELFNGCWYGTIVENGGSLAIDKFAGFVCGEGKATLETTETTVTVTLEGFKDRNGHEISGTFTIEADDEEVEQAIAAASMPAPAISSMKLVRMQ